MSSVFQRLHRSAATFAARTAYQASMHAVAVSHGLDPAEIASAVDPNAVRHKHGDAAERAAARQEAIYLSVVVFKQSYRLVGEVAGLSKVGVLKAVRAVEERREDRAIDRALDEVELELMA